MGLASLRRAANVLFDDAPVENATAQRVTHLQVVLRGRSD